MERIRAIIFDKDGTLFPYSLWAESVRNVLYENLPLENREDEEKEKIVSRFSRVFGLLSDGTTLPSGLFFTRSFIRASISFAYLTIRYAMNIPRTVKAVTEMRRRERYGFSSSLSSFDFSSLRNTLSSLKEKGLILAIFTNDTPSSLSLFLSALGDGYFDFTLSGKKDRRSLAAFRSVSGIPLSSVLLVSDTVRDLRNGKKAGAGMMAGIRGTEREEDLLKHSDKVISSLEELIPLFTQQCHDTSQSASTVDRKTMPSPIP